MNVTSRPPLRLIVVVVRVVRMANRVILITCRTFVRHRAMLCRARVTLRGRVFLLVINCIILFWLKDWVNLRPRLMLRMILIIFCVLLITRLLLVIRRFGISVAYRRRRRLIRVTKMMKNRLVWLNARVSNTVHRPLARVRICRMNRVNC